MPARADAKRFNFVVLEDDAGMADGSLFTLTVSNEDPGSSSSIKFELANDFGGDIHEVYWDTNGGPKGSALLDAFTVHPTS